MSAASVTVLSLGAGVQSSALILAMDRGDLGPRADFAVFADTGDEPASVYRWLWTLAGAVSIPILIGSAGRISDDMRAGLTSGRPPLFIKNPDGSRGLLRRQCTGDYKIDVIHKTVRRELGYRKGQRFKHHVDRVIGISRDEPWRIKPAKEAWATNVYPLVDARWTRETCARYVERLGLGRPPRSACVFCPFHNDDEWIRLRDEEPEAFAEACRFDDDLRTNAALRRALNGTAFVHDSLVPLRDVALVPTPPDRQINLFNNECEGMCGV